MMRRVTRENAMVLPGVISLGKAMSPLRSMLQARMARFPDRTLTVQDMSDAISQHGEKLADRMSKLADRINALGAVMSSDGDEIAMHREVGRLELRVEDLLDDYDELRQWDAYGADAYARDLLEGIYDHVLTEILHWFDDVVEALADPVAAARCQGLPTHGRVDLDLRLTITDPPQLDELRHWLAQSGSATAFGLAARDGRSGADFWNTVGAVALGYALGDWLFGGDD